MVTLRCAACTQMEQMGDLNQQVVKKCVQCLPYNPSGSTVSVLQGGPTTKQAMTAAVKHNEAGCTGQNIIVDVLSYTMHTPLLDCSLRP